MQHPAVLPGLGPLIVIVPAIGPVPVPKAMLMCMLKHTLAVK